MKIVFLLVFVLVVNFNPIESNLGVKALYPYVTSDAWPLIETLAYPQTTEAFKKAVKPYGRSIGLDPQFDENTVFAKRGSYLIGYLHTDHRNILMIEPIADLLENQHHVYSIETNKFYELAAAELGRLSVFHSWTEALAYDVNVRLTLERIKKGQRDAQQIQALSTPEIEKLHKKYIKKMYKLHKEYIKGHPQFLLSNLPYN
ncbi:uncharacterized protein LOC117173753 [Belonocnema kinseyi]|uniref:uncharacterized protein LOC117173753 n=1 Tax=Belonocnema kinseyi TaxID=2817044 RepID=UPI00143D0F59|nr:uncharacterized protein LOC117173753 [Belonocnema kinseyi]